MDTKTALGAAGGVSLTVVGAVTALVLLLGGGASATAEEPTANETVVEYVDQYGNPVEIQQPLAASPEVIVSNGDLASVEGDEQSLDMPTEYTEAEEAEYAEGEHEEEDHEAEYGEGEEGEEAEYAEGEHEEDDD